MFSTDGTNPFFPYFSVFFQENQFQNLSPNASNTKILPILSRFSPKIHSQFLCNCEEDSRCVKRGR